MAKKNSIRRKRYYTLQRVQLKRKLSNEKKKLQKEISRVLESNATPNDENQLENDNTTAVDTEFHSKLREWALKYNVRTYCLRDLLKILNGIGVPFLPKDPATFLRTPKTFTVENVANGQFWYSGVANNLRKIIQTADKSMKLQLNFHVDGLQLFNSSSKQFWPILGQIHGNIVK